MKPGKETALVRQLLDYLALRGVFAWRQNQGAVAATYKGKRRFVRFAGATGISDIIGVLGDGRLLAVEAKVKPNRPTAEQLAFLERIADAGGVAIVAYSVDDLMKAIP